MKITIIIDDKNCEVDVLKEQDTEERCEKSVSQYARFFGSGNPCWNEDPEFNLLFLRQQQMYANSLLKARGYLFLNDVYDMLGIPRSTEGQVVGWTYKSNNPIGDNYVDFGIFNNYNSKSINGFEKAVLLDFNVDGCILDVMN